MGAKQFLFNEESMMNLKFCQMSKKINKFEFASVYSVPMERITFHPLKLNKYRDILLIDLFAHLVGLEVQKYLPIFHTGIWL